MPLILRCAKFKLVSNEKKTIPDVTLNIDSVKQQIKKQVEVNKKKYFLCSKFDLKR